MSNLKFICPLCGGIEIEAVQQNAQVTQKVTMDRDGTIEWSDIPEIGGDDIWTERFQCASCGKVLPLHYGNGDEMDQLREYLESQDYNRQIVRTRQELAAIAAAVDALVDQAKDLAYKEDLYNDGCDELKECLREFYERRNALYEAIGGCDELLVDVDEEVGDRGEAEGGDEQR